MSTENRIWVALEHPREATSDTSKWAEIGNERARLANNMLARLSSPEDNPGNPHFAWDSHAKCYVWRGAFYSTALKDNGYWFNLDYLGRD